MQCKENRDFILFLWQEDSSVPNNILSCCI